MQVPRMSLSNLTLVRGIMCVSYLLERKVDREVDKVGVYEERVSGMSTPIRSPNAVAWLRKSECQQGVTI